MRFNKHVLRVWTLPTRIWQFGRILGLFSRLSRTLCLYGVGGREKEGWDKTIANLSGPKDNLSIRKRIREFALFSLSSSQSTSLSLGKVLLFSIFESPFACEYTYIAFATMSFMRLNPKLKEAGKKRPGKWRIEEYVGKVSDRVSKGTSRFTNVFRVGGEREMFGKMQIFFCPKLMKVSEGPIVFDFDKGPALKWAGNSCESMILVSRSLSNNFRLTSREEVR